MSRGVFQLRLLGRFGNCCFQYCFARAYSEMHDLELQTDPWVGEQIFEIKHPRCEGDLPRRDENNLRIGEANISYRSYSQRQRCADYYSLGQIREWFQFRPEVNSALRHLTPKQNEAVGHLRRGDYAGSGYPLVSLNSYLRYSQYVQEEPLNLTMVTEDAPNTQIRFTGELSFMPDFYMLARARILLRANSSFSFWAAAIAIAHHNARVFSPIITGLAGGIEHDCRFQPDNWARIAELDCVDQITIKP